MIKKRRYCYLEFFWVSIPLYSLGFNWTVFSIKSVWKPYDSSRRGCSDTRIFFLFRFFFIHISHVPFQTTSCFILKKRFSIWIAASGKYKKCSLPASRYSLNCSLLAKQFFLSLLVLAKKSQCSHARECSQRPFFTPAIKKLTYT